MDLKGQSIDDRYLLGAQLGEGTDAQVYYAMDRHLRRTVAVKLLRPELCADPVFVDRFEREARSAGRLNHDHILPIFDYGQALGTYYLVMEYMRRGDLRSCLRPGQPLPCDVAVRLAAEIADGLGAAHARGIVHRDVKPANVLLTDDGHAKVADFGIAKLLDVPTVTPAAVLLGTPYYLAPEQAGSGKITPATDVYALGVLLYEMLAGQRPFAGEGFVQVIMQHVRCDAPPVTALNPAVPPALAVLVARALAKDPAARFADGAAFGKALRTVGRAPRLIGAPSVADQPAGAPSVARRAASAPNVAARAASAPPPASAARPAAAIPSWAAPPRPQGASPTRTATPARPGAAANGSTAADGAQTARRARPFAARRPGAERARPAAEAAGAWGQPVAVPLVRSSAAPTWRPSTELPVAYPDVEIIRVPAHRRRVLRSSGTPALETMAIGLMVVLVLLLGGAVGAHALLSTPSEEAVTVAPVAPPDHPEAHQAARAITVGEEPAVPDVQASVALEPVAVPAPEGPPAVASDPPRAERAPAAVAAPAESVAPTVPSAPAARILARTSEVEASAPVAGPAVMSVRTAPEEPARPAVQAPAETDGSPPPPPAPAAPPQATESAPARPADRPDPGRGQPQAPWPPQAPFAAPRPPLGPPVPFPMGLPPGPLVARPPVLVAPAPLPPVVMPVSPPAAAFAPAPAVAAVAAPAAAAVSAPAVAAVSAPAVVAAPAPAVVAAPAVAAAPAASAPAVTAASAPAVAAQHSNAADARARQNHGRAENGKR